MGLLAYNPYDPRLRYLEGGAIAPAPSPAPAPVARPRPQAPAAPQLPSLTAPMNGLPMGPDPFAPPPVAPPVRAMPQAPQAPAPQPNRWASAWQGFTGQAGLPEGASFADRFNASVESPGMGLGLSLLAASAPGADAGTFANSFNAFNQQRTERERNRRQDARLATQDQRDASIFARQEAEWTNQDRLRAARQRAIAAETDPTRRAQLEALTDEGYGQLLIEDRRMAFQANEGRLDRETTLRAANARAANENSLGRYFQAQDAATIGELNQQAAQLQAVGLPQLQNLRDTIARAGTALTGQPIDYNTRITLGRYFNGSSADRQTLEMWRAQILGPALETLRGMGAMSEREMDAAINSFSNPDMTLGAAMQLLDQRIAIAQRRVQTAEIANQYFQEYGGLTGAGPGWTSYLSERLNGPQGGQQTPGSTQPGGAPPTPQQSAPRATPSSQDVRTLEQNPSPERRRQFDEVYGPGAAARVLGNRVQGRGGASRPLF